MVYRAPNDQDEGDVHGGTRVCRICETRKSMTEFHWVASRRHRARRCKSCVHTRQAELIAMRKQAGELDSRKDRLRREYGLTPAEVDQMRADQGDACGLCGKPFGRAHGDRMHIDHCHVTGHVRALLCHNCNIGLGHFQDDEELVLKAAEYLRHHRERTTELGEPTGRELTQAQRRATRRAAALRQHASVEGRQALQLRSEARRGEGSTSARLVEQQAQDIRAIYAQGGTTYRELGEKFDVSPTLIGLIVRRKIWTHV